MKTKKTAGPITTLLILAFATTLLGPGAPRAWAAYDSSLASAAASLHTPQDLQKFMRKHLRYQTDQDIYGQADYWQEPEEMLRNGVGDCEDFALFAQEMLRRMGYNAFLLSLYWEDNAHTIVVFEQGAEWGYFDLDKLKFCKATSLAALADKLGHRWLYLGMMRKEGTLGLISRKFRPDQALVALTAVNPGF